MVGLAFSVSKVDLVMRLYSFWLMDFGSQLFEGFWVLVV